MTVELEQSFGNNGGDERKAADGGEKKDFSSNSQKNSNTGGGTQYNAHTWNQYFRGAGEPLESMDKLLQDLGKLPPSSYPYRHPLHGDILEALEDQRIVVLTSDEEAAFITGYTVANDPEFADCKKRALYITRLQDRDRKDLDLMSLTDQVVQQQRQIVVVEIGERCTFLEAILHTPRGALGNIRVKLEQHSSYVILVIDDELLATEDPTERVRAFYRLRVSHLHYLLSRHFAERTGEIERRVCEVLGSLPTAAERRHLYERVTEWLAQGTAYFLTQLEEMNSTESFAPAVRPIERSITSDAIFKDDSAVHQCAAFVAASFPGINQKDFDRLVRLLLDKEKIVKEEVRDVRCRGGKLVPIFDRKEERCADRWDREADKIFHDCALRTMTTGSGAWAVDFSESYLRGDVRDHLSSRYPWYVKRQCERLQQSDILFAPDLSSKAVEGLVRLFVDRAIADPTGFGSIWLLDVVRGAHHRTDGDDESGTNTSDRNARQLSDSRPLLYERLAILIREMADHDVLRPVIRQFFEYLVTQNQLALLQLILDVAPRLRYVSEFDPLIWMRRLLQEGTKEVRELTYKRLIELARRAGPRIYEFLDSIHSWLPKDRDIAANPSVLDRYTFNFPFAYCGEMSMWVEPGAWPSEHPLFYTLPEEPEDARAQLGPLLDWIVDRRAAALEKADASDPLLTAEALRIGYVADLLEHWMWVLEGGRPHKPAPQAQKLLGLIVEEIVARLKPRERTWMQRAWQRRQEEQLKLAANLTGPDRLHLVARKDKLDELRLRFASCANVPTIPIQGEPTP